MSSRQQQFCRNKFLHKLIGIIEFKMLYCVKSVSQLKNLDNLSVLWIQISSEKKGGTNIIIIIIYFWQTTFNVSVPKKNMSCIAAILDIFTEPIPLCSLFSPLSSHPNFVCLAPLLAELAYEYSVMLLIHQLRCTFLAINKLITQQGKLIQVIMVLDW